MLFRLLAHAAEFHEENTGQIEHIMTEWWAGLGLYLLFILFVLKGLSKRLPLATRLSLILGASLIIGLVFYRWAPAVSGAAIVVGFVSSLVLTLGGAAES